MVVGCVRCLGLVLVCLICRLVGGLVGLGLCDYDLRLAGFVVLFGCYGCLRSD